MKKSFLFLAAFLFPQATYAQYTGCEPFLIPKGMYDLFQTGDFDWIDLINYGLHIICFLISIAGMIAVILIMIGGFQYIVGAMSEDKERGSKTLKNAVIGFVVILLAWIIVDIVISLVISA